MSPMRRVVERVPEVQGINITKIPRDPTDTNIMEQENEGQDIIPESSQPIEEVLPLAVRHQTSVRDDTIREPKIVVEHIPLLNGGPPTSREEHRTAIISTAATTTFATTTATIPRESVSVSSTPQVSSTGIEEGVPLHKPICLTEEDPQITCSICNIVDCMIHNPRHRYCTDCGQRLMGPHVCPNETEHSDPTRTQISTMTRTQPTQIEDRRTHISVALLAPLETSYHDLSTYDEAILSDQGITARPRIAPGVRNVLHHIDYSSDPEEARIHFELTSPSRHIRGHERHASP